MDLGDGTLRHPLALYELIFLVLLAITLKQIQKKSPEASGLKNGELFKWFMISYFGFRFFIEFLKPNEFFVLGLSSVQILCIICLIYYYKTIFGSFKFVKVSA